MHRNLGGLAVADFTDKDNVGILTYDGGKAVFKRVSRVLIDLCLRNTGEMILNWIFNGNNFNTGFLARFFQECIGCGCFPRAGRSGGDDHSVRALEFMFHDFIYLRLHTQIFKCERDCSRMQDTHHDRFSVGAGER